MNKLDLSQAPHLHLIDISRTFFTFDGHECNVHRSPANVFHAWATQYAESIEGVDAQVWAIHHRWNFINTLLEEGILHLSEPEVGTGNRKLYEPEETNSTSEVPEVEEASNVTSERVPKTQLNPPVEPLERLTDVV